MRGRGGRRGGEETRGRLSGRGVVGGRAGEGERERGRWGEEGIGGRSGEEGRGGEVWKGEERRGEEEAFVEPTRYAWIRANLSPGSPVIILVVSEVHLDHGWGSKQAPPPTSDATTTPGSVSFSFLQLVKHTRPELRSAYSEEIMGIRREEEMEMSEDDCEESPCKRMRAGVYEQSLKEENDSLRWQLDSYRNEVELLRKDQVRNSRADDERVLSQTNGPDVQIQLLQQSLHSVQQQLLSLQDRLRSKEAELEQAKEEHRWLEGQMVALQQRLLRTNVEAVEGPITELHLQEANGGVLSLNPSRERSSGAIVQGGVASEKEAVLLGIMSTFLHVHPFGANLEYLWSYIQRLDSQVSAADLERLMVRLPTMFRQELSGVGANLEKRWTFCGFDSLSSA
ncbi:Ecto-NOX disulfide-thiol exchanger 1 [Takifugu flavidus]|uniref:Ecto-NOX disulfide-thiol exchanger 1 n=1 Tax=Takifugu flavidus TaxID=433684 RepID=A0A5C6PK56_9TELE|nr:Ecto-NOX disulfide-thiol exchanger 1 [Takifugu flavidus]